METRPRTKRQICEKIHLPSNKKEERERDREGERDREREREKERERERYERKE